MANSKSRYKIGLVYIILLFSFSASYSETSDRLNHKLGLTINSINSLFSEELLFHKIWKQEFSEYLKFPPDTSDCDTILTLNWSRQEIAKLPSEIRFFSKVRRLLLHHNALTQLDGNLAQCQTLEELDVASNQLQTIPQEVWQLANLKKLVLKDNNLDSLPDELVKLKNLEILDISNMHSSLAVGHNHFTELPSVICQLPKLERLFMEKLAIAELPEEFEYMDSLRLISLRGSNKLNLRQAFNLLSFMPNLEILDISFMRLTHLPVEIAWLDDRLKVLIWRENWPISELEQSRVRQLMPNTRVYFGDETTPMLRFNSLETILKGSK